MSNSDNTKYMVLKTNLENFLKKKFIKLLELFSDNNSIDNDFHHKLKTEISQKLLEVVRAYNNISYYACQYLKMLIIVKLNKKEFNIEEILNEKNIELLLRATANNKNYRKHVLFQPIFERMRNEQENMFSLDLLGDISIEICTNYKNNITANYFKYLRKFLDHQEIKKDLNKKTILINYNKQKNIIKKKMDEIKNKKNEGELLKELKKKKKILNIQKKLKLNELRNINNKVTDYIINDYNNIKQNRNEIFEKYIQNNKKYLLPEPKNNSKNIFYDLKVFPFHFFLSMFNIVKFFEKKNNEEQDKDYHYEISNFNLFPQYNPNINHCIKFQAYNMKIFLTSLKTIKSIKKKIIDKYNTQEIWELFFKLDKNKNSSQKTLVEKKSYRYLSQNYDFSFEISSDGYCVNLLYTNKLIKFEKSNLNKKMIKLNKKINTLNITYSKTNSRNEKKNIEIEINLLQKEVQKIKKLKNDLHINYKEKKKIIQIDKKLNNNDNKFPKNTNYFNYLNEEKKIIHKKIKLNFEIKNLKKKKNLKKNSLLKEKIILNKTKLNVIEEELVLIEKKIYEKNIEINQIINKEKNKKKILYQNLDTLSNKKKNILTEKKIINKHVEKLQQQLETEEKEEKEEKYFVKKKKEFEYINDLNEASIEKLKNKQIIAIDPNKHDLLYCVNYDPYLDNRDLLVKKKKKNFKKKKKKNLGNLLEESRDCSIL